MDEDGDGSAALAIGKGTPANIVKTRNSEYSEGESISQPKIICYSPAQYCQNIRQKAFD